MNREDARHDRNVDTTRMRSVAEPEVVIVVEEHLRDRLVGAGCALLDQHIHVVVVGGRLRVTFRISRDGDFEPAAPLDAVHQIGRALIAGDVRLVRRAHAIGRVAAQCHEMTDSVGAIGRENVRDRFARSADTRDVRRRLHAIGAKLEHGGKRAFACRPAGAERERACDRRGDV